MNDIVEHGADRVLSMFERQAAHRQSLEQTAIKGDTVRANMGLAAGFIVAMFALWISYDLVKSGHQISGSVIGTASLVSLVSVFVYGSQSRRKERSERDQRRVIAAEQMRNR